MEYLIDFNATRAALKAGYSENNARSQGSRMLTNANIKTFLDKETTKVSNKLEVTKDLIVQELAKIAFHDIRKMYNDDGMLISIPDLDDETAATISSFKSRKENQGQDDYDTIDEYKRYDKVKTLELLGKHLGMFDSKEGGGGSIEELVIEIE